jgi:cell division protein FtsQ
MPEPLSDPIGHDHEPDRAALDELRRAFGVDVPDDDLLGATGEVPYSFEVVEQEALTTETAASSPLQGDAVIDSNVVDEPTGHAPGQAPPAKPTIITIDDFSRGVGGVVGGPADPPVTTAGPLDRPVIAIDADDLPDAVYVEGDLGGGDGSIVFIEDDPNSDALTPETDRDLRRGIEPRMRERRVAVKRAQSRKRIKWAVAIMLVVLVGVGTLATFGSSLFAVRADQVTVTGNIYTDPVRLQAVIDDLVGTPVLLADTQRLERQLETIPWVEHAKIVVDFPHAARIDIAERSAVATYQGPDQRFRVLDRSGRVLDVLDKYPFAYVLVTGPDPADLDPGEFAPRGYAGAAELAMNLTATVRGNVARLEVTSDGSRLVMWLDDGSEVYFGEASDLFVKIVRLETVLGANPGREPGPIDVSTAQTTS